MISKRCFRLADLGAVAVAFFTAYWILPHLHPVVLSLQLHGPGLAAAIGIQSDWNGRPPSPSDWLWVLLAMSFATLLFNELTGGYGAMLREPRTRIVFRNLIAPLSGLSLVTMIGYAFKSPGISRILLFLSVAFSSAALIAYRLILRAYLARRGRSGAYAKNTVLLGTAPALEWMIRFFEAEVLPSEYRILGYLRIHADQATPAASHHIPCLGTAGELGEILIHQPIQEVIAIQPASEADWLIKVIQDCDYFRIPLWIVPQALLVHELRDLRYAFFQDRPLHLPAVALRPHELDSGALFIKRVFDVVVSVLLLALLSPVFLAVALAIKLTTPRLPVFYPWRVVGLKGRGFTGYKFTTMAADIDARAAQADLTALNEMSGPVFKIKADPRVTRLGHVLRKFSINELPQLWSVLKGDMSLVGPRPAFPHELARYELWHKRKLSVQPGITCLWQVRGRNRIREFDDWVRMDLEYIHHWSLWLDLKILVRTAWIVVGGSGS
jgi:exopolysaccharide biosynthesis polyprenyl glycosylphosphotransferase